MTQFTENGGGTGGPPSMVDCADMIVSVHIPKTAGVSFRTGLRQRFGDRLLLDYGDRPLSDSISDRWRRLRRRAEVHRQAGEITASYDAVHGHFIASKYLSLGERAALCTFFRDPVERLISQYHFWLHHSYPDNRMWARMHAHRMTPGQLASLPRQRGLYRLFTAGLPMERFAFVGLTEEYRTSLNLFKAMFDIDLPYHRANTGGGAGGDVDRRERSKVRAAQRKNLAIYDAARHRFDLLCRRHSVT